MQILAPSSCPSCGSPLEWVKDQLYCRSNECPAKSSKTVEHFAKTMKIKGLGPSTIEKLEISDITEIYEIDLGYAERTLNSEKLASKLLDEIEQSKQESLNLVLPAFGIPLIGKSVTDKLAAVAGSIFEIDEETCKAANLGPKATENILYWLDTYFHKYESLPFSFEFTKTRATGKVICITGKLTSYKTKAEAAKALELHGYTVVDSVTAKTQLLVSEDGKSSEKTRKAESLGISIITNLKTLMEND